MDESSREDNKVRTKVSKLNLDKLRLVDVMDPSNDVSRSICEPITKLEDAWAYVQNPPRWVDRIVELAPRSSFVVKNERSDCHVEEEKFRPALQLDHQSVPRTLVCHDMKGGYLEDRFVGAINIGNCYSFYRWSHIDTFVYFSHHLITIPPFSWINVAHTNGVKILGTFITEFDAGEAICKEIFSTKAKMREFVNILVNVCLLFKFDGWLLNIENKLENVALLKEFVELLTKTLHFRRPGSLIIWYDSVTCAGELKWQNELNEQNKCFFDLCDGIFLNYTWTPTSLENTVKNAQHRSLDVYVGIDVFGRNCYGGGRFNTYLAAEKVREHGLSIALFAQGWTHETLDKEPCDTVNSRFLNRDNAFWRSLWPYLYTHPIKTPFKTFFYTGADKHWFKLHSQELQLSRFLHPETKLPEDLTVPTLIDTCNCLQLHLDDANLSCLITRKNLGKQNYVHRLFLCDIAINGHVALYYYLQNSDDCLNLILLAKCSNGSIKKIVCNGKEKTESIENCSLMEINPSQDENHHKKILAKQPTPTNWTLRCYSFHFYEGKIIEIAAKVEEGDDAHLCGFGLIHLAS